MLFSQGYALQIVAPVLDEYLLAPGLAPTRIFLVACLFALIAALATTPLAFRGYPVKSVAKGAR